MGDHHRRVLVVLAAFLILAADRATAQHAGAFDLGTTDAAVELHPADGRQVVALSREEQVVEQRFGGILGWRLTRTHHAVDFYQRL